MENLERRSFSLTSGDGNTLVGYAAVFNKRSANLASPSKPLYEIIQPGAFTETLNDKRNLLALYNHNPDYVLGSTDAGTLKLSQDDQGLRFQIALPDTQYARDLKVLVDRGDVKGGSFAFRTRPNGLKMSKDDEGNPQRILSALDVGEVTITGDPAYPDTSVALRNLSEFVQEQEGIVLALIEQRKRKFALYLKM